MKLIQITDVRRNQVWMNKKNKELYLIQSIDPLSDYEYSGIKFDCSGELITTFANEHFYHLEFHTLVGFYGITHEQVAGKLRTLSRPKVEIDDCYQFFKDPILVVDDRLKQQISTSRYGPQSWHKVGIYGVHYEYVNNKLGEEL